MKRLWTVFEFELFSYIKNKSFIITTVLICLIIGLGMFAPRVFDMSDLLGTESSKEEEGDSDEEAKEQTLGIYDESGYFTDTKLLSEVFKDTDIKSYDSAKALEKAVKKEDIQAGFYVIDDLHYNYYVMNRDMMDENTYMFDEVLSTIHKQVYCAGQNIDYATFSKEYEAPVECEEKILGKDAADSYWYCYVLVIIIFMVIIIYGVMIATAVTTEKSNRSIEVLVTSIDSKYLLFGKVFAGAVAVLFQMSMILGVALIGYGINHEAWGDKLDMILDIPANVLVVFAIFGIGGFLFYAFLYGALGALVSKTEDINKSCGNLQMIIMIVYVVVLLQLTNIDGMAIKICSYLPFSSYSAMFARVGMGKVATWEIVLSAVILYVSIFFVGWLGAKIYRMGTLRYGNPIKFTNALKDIKTHEK